MDWHALDSRLRRIEGRLPQPHAGSRGFTRQPRLAVTVRDYLATPQYPAAPLPPVYDPDTGELITPGTPHPDTFPFAFVDAEFNQAGGRVTPSVEQRQAENTHIAYVHNLNRVYIPEGEYIWVFEDNKHWWTSWNNTTSTGGNQNQQVGPHGITRVMWMWASVAHVIDAYGTPEDVDLVWAVFWPELASLAEFGLEYDTDNDRLTATRDVSLLGHAHARLTVSSGDSGTYTVGHGVEVQFNLQPYELAGTPPEETALGLNWVLPKPSWQSYGIGVGAKNRYADDVDIVDLTEGQFVKARYTVNPIGDSLDGESISFQLKLAIFERDIAHADGS